MNDHEKQRIAAAMNMLRPDWPTKQLVTMLGDKRISDRPRRDVCVALAWIACETDTHNPYRVLEAGPWWRAAAVDGPTGPNRLAQKPPWCKNCGQGETATIHLTGGECEFAMWPAQEIAAQRRAELIQEARRASLTALTPKKRDAPERPERCGDHGCIRGYMHTGPHLGPAEPLADTTTAATDGESK